MKQSPTLQPIAFLSSMTWEFGGLDSTSRDALRTLRRQAWEQDKERLWVAECDYEELSQDSHMEIVDFLLRKVQEAKVFICLLGGRRRGRYEHGTLIELANRRSAVSFFEAELFMAALLQKPIHVLTTKDFDPGPRLSSMLDLLEFAIPKDQWQIGLSEPHILRRIHTIVDEVGRSKGLPEMLAKREKTVRSRAIARKYQLAIGENRPRGQRSVFFLGGFGDGQPDPPDRELISELLDQEQRMDNSDARLGRLWIAIRELMGRPPESDSSGDFLELWNRSLKRWCDAAGWYGLHGHVDLGFAAAGFSMARVRELMRDRNIRDVPDKMLEYPGGGIASALFSTAKWMPTRKLRREVLKDGQVHLKRSLDECGALNTALALMLGSYGVALGNTVDGVRYFKKALKLTEAEGVNPGVSHSELGAAFIRQGRIVSGLRHLKAGSDAIREYHGKSSGEYARSLRKLMVGYAINGRLMSASRVRDELRELAIEHGYYDQYR